MALSISVVLGAMAAAVEVGGYYYELNAAEQTAQIAAAPRDGFAYNGAIEVPSTIDYDDVTYTVIGCRPYAFSGSTITSLTLPETVASLAAYLCSGCASLTTVRIAGPVPAIPGSAFRDCAALESIEWPGTVTTIGTYAFYGCTALKTLTIPEGLKHIDNTAFGGCTALTDIHLPESLETMGYLVFSGCTSLVTFRLPDGLVRMDHSCLENCTALTTLYIGNSLTEVASYTCFGCTSLTDVYCQQLKRPVLQGGALGKSIQHLYVPNEAVSSYGTSRTWSAFPHILPLQCATPTITLSEGRIVIATETDLRYTPLHETFAYSIECDDVVEEETALPSIMLEDFGELALNYRVVATARIDDTATAPSETTYATLFWRVDGEPQENPTHVRQAPTTTEDAILVSARDGRLDLSGLRRGEHVALYSLDGRLLSSTQASTTALTLDAPTGQTLILRVGKKAVKVRTN